MMGGDEMGGEIGKGRYKKEVRKSWEERVGSVGEWR